ncbi:shikimate dehydrogenase [Macrococcus sp. DPC7161]|uniref:shikimate dehydrogenase n=1 Tax=Macrococcus sp. DPC7161 TaxID=2507060 RepID=UPI00100B8F44|nr:shikimate dehydrogenase [Macrococcus sp. DPC7161]RXK19418.1 shikimate dehydrogenase [Macrococcus sp. DPC7161]
MKFAVIGHPILHSLSPLMHHANFKALNRDDEYIALNIDPNHFHHIKDIINQSQLDGFNVTIPYKVDIMQYCDEIDLLAQKIGAVNTVAIQDGKWIGYNTDADGYIMDLKQNCNIDYIKQVLIIGAGGASRALATKLYDLGCNITITNRSQNRLSDWKIPTEYIALSDINKIDLKQFQLIINTTPVGMSGFNNEMLIDLNHCQKDTMISDIIYNPAETEFLKQAKDLKLPYFNGLGMFVNQGALSFKYWTGIDANREAMKAAVIKKLNL